MKHLQEPRRERFAIMSQVRTRMNWSLLHSMLNKLHCLLGQHPKYAHLPTAAFGTVC
jgi:hypothetical protein